MNDLITIIIPVYNVEGYLKRCLDSVVNQTYKNTEIILIDDGSSDNSGKICDEYAQKDNRIKVFHKANGGQSSARNLGIDNASGNYIGFIDSDDWIEREMYEVLYRNIVMYDADVSDIDAVVVENEIPFVNCEEKIKIRENADILKDYFMTDRYSCCRKLYKRTVIGNIRFIEGKINEDVLANYLFLKNSKRIVKSSLTMYYYYNNPTSTTGKIFRERDFDLLDICTQLVELSKDNKEIEHLAKVKFATAYYSILGRYLAYKSDEFENKEKRVLECHKNLRKNYIFLMKSHLNIKKKIMITVVTLFNPIKIKRILRKIKKDA